MSVTSQIWILSQQSFCFFLSFFLLLIPFCFLRQVFFFLFSYSLFRVLPLLSFLLLLQLLFILFLKLSLSPLPLLSRTIPLPLCSFSIHTPPVRSLLPFYTPILCSCSAILRILPLFYILRSSLFCVVCLTATLPSFSLIRLLSLVSIHSVHVICPFCLVFVLRLVFFLFRVPLFLCSFIFSPLYIYSSAVVSP